MRYFRVDGFQRISKAEARRAFNAGAPVYLCAVHLRPGGPWHPECCIWNAPDDGDDKIDFETAVAAFEFYNCTDYKTGKYAAYYVKA